MLMASNLNRKSLEPHPAQSHVEGSAVRRRRAVNCQAVDDAKIALREELHRHQALCEALDRTGNQASDLASPQRTRRKMETVRRIFLTLSLRRRTTA